MDLSTPANAIVLVSGKRFSGMAATMVPTGLCAQNVVAGLSGLTGCREGPPGGGGEGLVRWGT